MSPTGAIKFYSEKSGYGFIEWQGEDAFSHVSEIQDESAEALVPGDQVEFETQDGDKGPIAVSVKRAAT